MTNLTYYKLTIKMTTIISAILFVPLLLAYIFATNGHFPAEQEIEFVQDTVAAKTKSCGGLVRM